MAPTSTLRRTAAASGRRLCRNRRRLLNTTRGPPHRGGPRPVRSALSIAWRRAACLTSVGVLRAESAGVCSRRPLPRSLAGCAINPAAAASFTSVLGAVCYGARSLGRAPREDLRMSKYASPGRPWPVSALRVGVGMAVIALAVAACGSSGSTSAAAVHSKSPMPEMSSSMPMPSESMSMGSGMLPMGASHMHVTIVSPMTGMKVTGNSVTMHVQVSGYTDTCALAGRPLMGGMEATATGHYHVLLDGSLINMFCTPTAVISLQNVKPGMHTLTVVPSLDDHAQVTANARNIMFDYAPAKPLPTLTGMMTMGKPSITIVSPKPGATVSGSFTVRVVVKNYDLSCALFGKPNLHGWGHWHLNLDTATGGMMGMGGMIGMGCSDVMQVSTAGLKAGSTHTLIALLVDNQHAPVMPMIASEVKVQIGT